MAVVDADAEETDVKVAVAVDAKEIIAGHMACVAIMERNVPHQRKAT